MRMSYYSADIYGNLDSSGIRSEAGCWAIRGSLQAWRIDRNLHYPFRTSIAGDTEDSYWGCCSSILGIIGAY